MGKRRVVSLLICIFFSGLAAIGILLSPLFRMGIGITNEIFLRWVHFWLSSIFLILIIIHIIYNRKALGNYIQKAKFRSIFAFALAGVLFVGLLCWGLLGPDLGITMGTETHLQLTGRVNNIAENCIMLDTRGVNKVLITANTQLRIQPGSNAAMTDIQRQTQLVVFGILDPSQGTLTAKEVVILR